MSGVSVSLVRGGTSKGVFLDLADLPADRDARDSLALGLMGSPDPMQIDGLGGTHSSTSKVVGVGPSSEAGVHLDYLFLQVGIDEAVVDDSGNCGNLSYAVGPWGTASGHAAYAGQSLVLRNLNTGRRLRSTFMPVPAGAAVEVRLDHLDPGGAVTGRLLPTGAVTDTWCLRDGREVEVSLVDVTSPVLMLRAEDVGVDGTEDRAGLGARKDLLDELELLRARAAEVCGLVTAGGPSRAVPRVSLLLPATRAPDADLVAVNLSLQRVHHAMPATSAMCVAAAARIPGTVAHVLVGGHDPGFPPAPVRLRHPRGTVHVSVALSADASGGPPHVDHVGATSTTRTLMSGTAFPGGTP
jgi:2-methylaconitate cis-trans-isomerase PrpF